MTNNQDPLRVAREALEAVDKHERSAFFGPDRDKNIARSYRGAIRKMRQALAQLDQLAANESPDDDLVELVARAMCVAAGFDPDEIMPNDGRRWRYYIPNADAALIALDLPARLQAAKDAGREEAAQEADREAFRQRTKRVSSLDDNSLTAVGYVANAIRERIGKP